MMQFILTRSEIERVLRNFLAEDLSRDFEEGDTVFNWLGEEDVPLDDQPLAVSVDPGNDD